MVSVPVEFPPAPDPPSTLAGFSVSPITVSEVAGTTITVVVTEPVVLPDNDAVSVTVVIADGLPAVTVIAVLAWPWGTVTMDGTGRVLESLVLSCTACPC